MRLQEKRTKKSYLNEKTKENQINNLLSLNGVESASSFNIQRYKASICPYPCELGSHDRQPTLKNAAQGHAVCLLEPYDLLEFSQLLRSRCLHLLVPCCPQLKATELERQTHRRKNLSQSAGQ